MKVLKNAKFTGNIKINDTNTDIYFQAYDDGVLQKLNATQCSFRIKNDTGYLITISNVSTENDYITFKSNELKPLPVGTYYLELWVEDGTGTYIYPDESFCKLRINENVTVAQGTTIPTISLDEYENKLQGYVDTAVADGTQKIESDFDKYVDSITDSTIATATKASQDAATAISTANDAESAAQNATNIANAAKSNADSASQAVATAQATANTANSKADAAQSTATDALNKATNNASSIASNSNSISDLSNKLLPMYNNQNNLFANPQLTGLKNWYHFNSVSLAGETYNGSEVVKLTQGDGSNYLAQDVKGIDAVNGYTFSVYLKGSTASSLHIDFRAGDKYNITATAEWTQISVSSKFGDQSYTRFYLWNNGTDPIYIASPKLVVWQMTYDEYKQLTGGSV